MQREIRHLVLHCSETSQDTTVESILKFWKAPPPKGNGWLNVGYHYIIKANGEAVELLPIEKVSNGVKGHNHDSIHICYIGGLNNKDNRTPEQIRTQLDLLIKFKKMFPNADIKGHRDFLKKGEPNWKNCPSFEVSEFVKAVHL